MYSRITFPQECSFSFQSISHCLLLRVAFVEFVVADDNHNEWGLGGCVLEAQQSQWQRTSKGNSPRVSEHGEYIRPGLSGLAANWHREMTKANIFAISKCRFLPSAFQNPQPIWSVGRWCRWYLVTGGLIQAKCYDFMFKYVYITANSKQLIHQHPFEYPPSSVIQHTTHNSTHSKLDSVHHPPPTCQSGWSHYTFNKFIAIAIQTLPTINFTDDSF